MKILTVVGARPQFIKAAAVSRKLRLHNEEILVHTGQHYDSNMSEVFFEEMHIPQPDYNLKISGGGHGEMTGRMLIELEKLLLEVQGKGAYMTTHLSRIKNVVRVTGMGLMLGLEITKNARDIAEKCLERGLIVLTAKDKLRLLPPLTIGKGEIDAGLKILNEVLSE